MTEEALQGHRYRVAPGATVDLASMATLPALADRKDKRFLRSLLQQRVERFSELQDKLYGEGRQALLLVFQGMDAAGKDSTIKRVTAGVNPQGFRVADFVRPTALEMKHSWLHRHWLALPERGRIGIFNRSHYEEVVTVRVRPELIAERKLPPRRIDDEFWSERLADIVSFEQHLCRNGFSVVKFFLHVSKSEQRRRLVKRIGDPDKHWKFDLADLEARSLWAGYQQAYGTAIQATSTTEAPWYVVPADDKPAMRAIVAAVVVDALEAMAPEYPQPDAKLRRDIGTAQRTLSG